MNNEKENYNSFLIISIFHYHSQVSYFRLLVGSASASTSIRRRTAEYVFASVARYDGNEYDDDVDDEDDNVHRHVRLRVEGEHHLVFKSMCLVCTPVEWRRQAAWQRTRNERKHVPERYFFSFFFFFSFCPQFASCFAIIIILSMAESSSTKMTTTTMPEQFIHVAWEPCEFRGAQNGSTAVASCNFELMYLLTTIPIHAVARSLVEEQCWLYNQTSIQFHST